MRSGNLISGTVSEFDERGLVLLAEGKLLPISWDDVETPSAYQVKKKLLTVIRGNEDSLTAEDHFRLGYFLAVRNHHTAAIAEFSKARKRDPAYATRIEQAWKEIQRLKEQNKTPPENPFDGPHANSPRNEAAPDSPSQTDVNYLKLTPEQHQEVLALCKDFGNVVREETAPDLVLLETTHFLIWINWPENTRNQIADWAEQMYSVLCREFGFPQDEPIWLGKCPIFCFKNKKQFVEFAKRYDQYDAEKILGYTRTESSGYVHVVLRRLGNEPADLDRFATTMVHEASHAFIHGYVSPLELPAWLGEGLANYTAQRVLGDRCRTGAESVAVARQFVQLNRSLTDVLKYDREELPPEYYPIAHSLVEFLIRTDRNGFVNLVRELKKNQPFATAWSKSFKTLPLSDLQREWESAVQRSLP